MQQSALTAGRVEFTHLIGGIGVIAERLVSMGEALWHV